MPLFTLTPGADVFPQIGQDATGNDTIRGLAGDDTINGGTGADRVQGGIGNDHLIVTPVAGSAVLDADSVYGGQDDDLILLDTSASGHVTAGAGMVLSGGQGTDVLQVQSGLAAIDLSAVLFETVERLEVSGTLRLASHQILRFDVIDVRGDLHLTDNGSATCFGLLRFDHLYMADGGQGLSLRSVAGQGDDASFSIIGGTGDDAVYGGNGADPGTYIGGRGNDTLVVRGSGADLVQGGIGNDRLTVTLAAEQGADSVYGGQGDDVITVNRLSSSVDTAPAGMVLSGGNGFDVVQIQIIYPGIDISNVVFEEVERVEVSWLMRLSSAQLAQFDVLGDSLALTDNGAVVARGLLQFDYLWMADGGQLLDLSDALVQNPDSSWTQIVGGNGDDTIISGDTTTEATFRGERGRDTLIVGGGVINGFGRNGFDGGRGQDSLQGSALGEGLYGGNGRDTITAGAGADLIYGGARGDLIYGGDGNDSLWGSGGRDTMTGGNGADSFVLHANDDLRGEGQDEAVITDFTVDPASGAGFIDRINLSLVDLIWPEPYAFVGAGPFTATRQVRVWQEGADAIVEVNIIGDPVAERTLRLLDVDASQIDATDFIL